MSTCTSCDENKNRNAGHGQRANTNITPVRKQGKWIDQLPFDYSFGVDDYLGIGIERYIPSWAISFCPNPEMSKGKGLQDPYNPNTFYKREIDGTVYRDVYDCGLRVGHSWLKEDLIPDCAIKTIHALKITEPYKLLQKDGLTTPLNDRQKGYIIETDNGCQINPNITLLDTVITNGCGGTNNERDHQLKAVITKEIITNLFTPISDYSKGIYGTAGSVTISTTTQPNEITQTVNLGNVTVPYIAPITQKWVLEVHFSARAEGIGNSRSYNNITTAGITGIVNGSNTISSGSATSSSPVGYPQIALKANLSTSGVFNVNQQGYTPVSVNITGINFGSGAFYPQIRFDNFHFSGVLKLVKI